jgi:methylase of polypeptide subunit release factors
MKTLVAKLDRLRALLIDSARAQHPQAKPEAITFTAQAIVNKLVFWRYLQGHAQQAGHALPSPRSPLTGWSDFVALAEAWKIKHPQSIFQPSDEELELTDALTPVQFQEHIAPIFEQAAWLPLHQLDLFDLGAVYELHLHGAAVGLARRKQQGVYYTPRPIIQYMVQHTLEPLLQHCTPNEMAALKVVDMACGAGGFILAAFDYLQHKTVEWYRTQGTASADALLKVQGNWQLHPQLQTEIILNNLFAVDVDPQAIAVTKLLLHLKLLLAAPTLHEALLPSLEKQVQCGNALVASDYVSDTHSVQPFDWQQQFPSIMHSGGFHAILGNPPYVNVRLITQSHSAGLKAYYRQKFVCAQKGFDLYVLFLEQAVRLLRPQGRCGMIVPNKLASLEYAAACRQLLTTQLAWDRITDLSGAQLFSAASVYPYILIGTKQGPSPDHHFQYHVVNSVEDLPAPKLIALRPQRELQYATSWQLPGSWPVELRVPTQSLATLAKIHSGTTGFSAQQVANALFEEGATPTASDSLRFIVSGNIDRYRIQLGQVRYMQKLYAQPCIARSSAVLSTQKKELFSAAKIVIAGMTQRLEAAWDEQGLALGVQVFAVVSKQLDYRYLLGLLNSRLMSHLFRTRFHAKRLAGNYLAINKGQLAQLPIRVISPEDSASQALQQAIQTHVERLLREPADAASEEQVDRLVNQLYQLTPAEVAELENLPG